MQAHALICHMGICPYLARPCSTAYTHQRRFGPRWRSRGSRRNVRVSTVPYVLGHSESEIHRLMRQAGLLSPITARLMRDAGLSRDMRVLDVGTGTGDVAILAADIVG